MRLRLRFPLDELRARYRPQDVDRALGAALNKLARKGRTALSRAARQRYMIKAADIARHVQIHRPSGSFDTRVLQYAGARIDLVKFGAREVRVSGREARVTRTQGGRTVRRSVRANKRQQRGVTVQVLRKGGRKVVRGKKGFGAFMADQGTGGAAVFVREGQSRLPLQKLAGPAIAEMVGHERVAPVFADTVRREGPVEFERAMGVFLDD